MNLDYKNKYFKYKKKYLELKGGAESIKNQLKIYLALSGNKLENIPENVIYISEPELTKHNNMFLELLQSDKKHIYQLPIIDLASKLGKNYPKIVNDLHLDAKFEKDLTELEQEYLNIINGIGNRVVWDTTGSWAKVLGVDRGTGIAGVPENTIILGFINV